MNDNENKTNAPIKLPVRDGGDTSILDADGKQIAFAVFAEMDAIIAALNEADALRAEVEGLREFIESLTKFESQDLDGYNYHDGFGEVAFEICGMRSKVVLAKGGNMLEAYAAIKPNAAAGEEGTE